MEANMSRHMSAAGVEGGAALIERAARHFASLGITSCAEASTDATSFAALLEADRGGRLPIRVTGLFTYSGATGLLADGRPAGVESDFLRIGGVKIWADGGMSSRTAAVDEPYLDPPGEMGMLIYDEETLTSMIGRCEEAGFQVAIHAQGERAIRTVLAAFARASAPGNPLRHRIEHGGAFTPELRDIAATQGIHVVSQPGFLSQLGEGFLAAFGPERSRYLYPFASLQRAGIVVAGSSDAPVIDASPFFAMRDAIERRTQAGRAIAADETITAAQALDLYTRHAAFVGGQEDRIGTLEVGKQADFVVVDRSPLDIPAASIAETTVHRTVVAGRVVFDDGSIGG
jgi:predicted amidohydrolase YtcJ